MNFMQLLFLSLCLLLPNLSSAQESDVDVKLQKMASQLAERIRAVGKNRVGVADFNDLQGNIPELGKYLAENFQGELVNNQLRVINRQRLSQLLIEKDLTAKQLLDPSNALTIGKAAGMEVIVTGTITPIDDRSIAVNVLALDIQGAEAIASARSTLVRTNSINDLLRSTVKQGGGSGSQQETSTITSTGIAVQNVSYTLMGDKALDLPKETCYSNSYNYGQICFENITTQPLILYRTYNTGNSNGSYPDMLIGKNARNCTELLMTNGYNKNQNMTYYFYFHTVEEDENRRYGKITVEVEGCKVKTRVINNDRIFLSKTEPK